MGSQPTRTLEMAFYCTECGWRGTAAGACQRGHGELTAIPHDGILGQPIGNYIPVARIGEGGMGAVYRAVQPAIGARVAIKILHAAGDANAAQRFLLEAQAVNRIRHPGVVKVIDAGALADNRPYLVMEWLDGIALADAIGGRPLPLGTACTIVIAVLDVLAAAHAEGIVHRDLKPHNIFLERGGRVVVLDFGIAKVIRDDAELSLTRTGAMVGTPSYMAPEQIVAGPVDERTDLYAVGVVLYELVTGRRAFEAAATLEILERQLAGTPEPPRGLPAALDAVIAKGMAKDPAARFGSAVEMAAAVRTAARGLADPGVAALVGAPRSHEAATVRARPPRPRTHARWPWILLAAGAIGGGGGVIWSVTRNQHHAVAIAAPPDAAPVAPTTPPDAPPVAPPDAAADAARAVIVTHPDAHPGPHPREPRDAAVDAPPAPVLPLPATTRLAGHGLAAFRADRWLDSAQAAARKLTADAALTRMTTTIEAGGISGSGQASYELRSPSHPGDTIRVIAARDAVEVLVVRDAAVHPYAARPRCTLDALWPRALAASPPDAKSIHVEYVDGAWTIGGIGDHTTLSDDCR